MKKILERKVKICEQQYGFMPKKYNRCTHCFKNANEKNTEKEKELHCVFMDLDLNVAPCEEKSCGSV